MSSYIFRVTGKKVKLTDGTTARLAVYAYKPVGIFGGRDADKFNRRAAFASGVPASKALIKRGGFDGVIVMSEKAGEPVYRINSDQPTFYDDAVMQDRFTVEGVQVSA